MGSTGSQKYDRQLRIWGEHGQAQLAQARVCLLNAGPTGSEALKNLVLGGIGEFTVVDGTKVEPADLGNNFLVEADSLGQPKARVVSALLQELNDSVGAKFVEECPDALIDSNPRFLSDFTLVIATQMREPQLLKLDRVCREAGCQLIVARSYGLMGLVRISAPEHCVVEAKPENAVDDLRLHKPWPELQGFMEGFDLDIDDSAIHSHIPSAIILLKCLKEWRQVAAAAGAGARAGGGGGLVPQSAKERAAFKDIISSHRRSYEEENYKEALASAFKAWAPPAPGPELAAVLADPCCTELSPSSPDFWVMAAALKEFMENEGSGDVPLEGSVPDMHSATEPYIRLQQLYRSKAEADVGAVEQRVRDLLLSKCGRDPASIPRPAIRQFCRNARNLRVLRYKPLGEEYEGKATLADIHRMLAAEEDSSSHAAALYMLLRAADQFAATYNRYPGSFEGPVEEEDVTRLKGLLQGLLWEGGSPRSSDVAAVSAAAVRDDLVSEFCRFGGSEIHCVAAVVGGIASQEAIKLITRQFVPLSGTLVYNAISQTSSVVSL